MTPLWILTALLLKHFICDFPLQRRYQYSNKGIYGHPGGLLHASIHALGTVLVFAFFAPLAVALKLAAIDAFIHYHIDWLKNRCNKRCNYNATSGDGFWILLGLDQFAHQLTYVLLVWLFTTGAV
jgi:hypothetical protein